MAEHSNVDLLRRAYDAFGKGDMEALGGAFADDIKWHIRGVGVLDGDYTGRDAVFGFFGRLAEETGGTFRLDVHDLLANDEHGVAIVTTHATRNGKTLDASAVHVSHVRDGRMTEFWGALTDPAPTLEFWA